ncbi:phosphatase PAP2 family protein [Paenarthrobacter sp. Z7-10]|uniref:phosphatase PAP2 family protein n=1 Tax=Paenarthrobacter sp. Z7-10 TaxID=2787635 RepID=UPI0022A9669B|nr:phosphatase PAP2 family protein [Paenarthrobacter sp. Z7-10]
MEPHATDNQRERSAARILSEVLGPASLGTILLVSSSLSSGWSLRNAGAAAVAVVFVTFGPLAGLLFLSRRGRVSDHHVSQRTQRAPVLAAVLGSMIIGTVLLVGIGAPSGLYLMILGLALGLVTVLVINLFWKLSIHAAVGAYFTAALVALFGPLLILTAAVPLLVGWSRVRLGAHTTAQVCCGWIVGVSVAAVFGWLTAVSL